jgi:hypothetical protein
VGKGRHRGIWWAPEGGSSYGPRDRWRGHRGRRGRRGLERWCAGWCGWSDERAFRNASENLRWMRFAGGKDRGLDVGKNREPRKRLTNTEMRRRERRGKEERKRGAEEKPRRQTAVNQTTPPQAPNRQRKRRRIQQTPDESSRRPPKSNLSKQSLATVSGARYWLRARSSSCNSNRQGCWDSACHTAAQADNPGGDA